MIILGFLLILDLLIADAVIALAVGAWGITWVGTGGLVI